MLTNLEKDILKELDKQNYRGDIIAFIMSKVDSEKKKFDLLTFLNNNTNVILSFQDIVSELKLINSEN